MLLVHGLPADTELVRDVLPRPADAARVPHLERLKLLHQLPERRDGPKTNFGIGVPRCSCELRGLAHGLSIYVDGCVDVNPD